jgi:hypothetical protein
MAIRTILPAPVWRVMSSAGTAEPVRMNCPGWAALINGAANVIPQLRLNLPLID